MSLLGPALLLLLIFLTGAALLALGLRGRRVNDHPHCRRCRFDLSGLDIDADGATCPECGAGLNGERSVRMGMRSARRGVAGLGGFLVLLALLGAGGVAYIQATGVNWDQIVPAGALVSQIPRADDEREAVLLAELARRLEDDAMPDNALARAAAMAIERQRDFERAWSDTWGDLIGAAWRRGLLSDEQMISALEGTIGVELNVRDRVRHGDRISLGYAYELGDRQSRGIPALVMQITPGVILMDGVEAELSQEGLPNSVCNIHVDQMSGRVGFGAGGMNGSVPPPESPGRRTFTTDLRFRVYDENQVPGDSRTNPRDLSAAGEPILDWTQAASVTTTVLEPGEETVALVVDDKLRAQVVDSLTASDAITEPKARGGRVLLLKVSANNIPIDYSFTAWCRRASGQEIRLGDFHGPAGYTHHTFTFGYRTDVGDDFTTERVDIILRPDREHVRNQQGFEKIWGEEVIIRGVRVERSDGVDSDGN